MKTIQINNKDYKLYFKYSQNIKGKFSFKNVPLSGILEVKNLLEYINSKKNFSPQVTTVARLENILDKTDFFEAKAVCMSGDVFVKEEGRQLAINRLAKSFRNTVNDLIVKKVILETYNNRKNR